MFEPHSNYAVGLLLYLCLHENESKLIRRINYEYEFIKMARAMSMKDANKPEDFLIALVELQKSCGVDNLKMSDYGFCIAECDTLARNARDTMGGLFLANPCEMTHEDCTAIFKRSYK